MDRHAAQELKGREVSTVEDQPIGTIAGVDVDRRTGDARWLVVDGHLVPAEGAWITDDDDVVVPYTAARILGAPSVGPDEEVDGVRHRTASVYYVRASLEER